MKRTWMKRTWRRFSKRILFISKKEQRQLFMLIVFGIPTYLLMRGVYGIAKDILKIESPVLMMFLGLFFLVLAYSLFDGRKK